MTEATAAKLELAELQTKYQMMQTGPLLVFKSAALNDAWRLLLCYRLVLTLFPPEVESQVSINEDLLNQYRELRAQYDQQVFI